MDPTTPSIAISRAVRRGYLYSPLEALHACFSSVEAALARRSKLP